jgi:hypothetical protein
MLYAFLTSLMHAPLVLDLIILITGENYKLGSSDLPITSASKQIIKHLHLLLQNMYSTNTWHQCDLSSYSLHL